MINRLTNETENAPKNRVSLKEIIGELEFRKGRTNDPSEQERLSSLINATLAVYGGASMGDKQKTQDECIQDFNSFVDRVRPIVNQAPLYQKPVVVSELIMKYDLKEDAEYALAYMLGVKLP